MIIRFKGVPAIAEALKDYKLVPLIEQHASAYLLKNKNKSLLQAWKKEVILVQYGNL